MKRLKLEDISNPPALKTQEVELEQWNKSVVVQGLTKAEETMFFLRSIYS